MLICPVCEKPLKKGEKTYTCENLHSFDIARKGYVNLLMSQNSKNKQHGDDKLMVRARRDFLTKDYYKPLCDALAQAADEYLPKGGTLLDAGCGECYYTGNIYDFLYTQGKNPQVLGVDISKNALELSSKGNVEKAVASVFSLPVASDSVDLLISIFAPYSGKEFLRVMHTGSMMLLVIPLEDHLWELKNAVYESPYKNEVADTALQGFEFLGITEVKDSIALVSNDDILNLFTMTPYYYKTSEPDYKKLTKLTSLTTKIEFGILAYKKL